MLFTIDKSQYNDMLNNCLNDLIKIEEYELCAEIKKQLDKKTRKKKEVL
jgi:protein-arginine kinase activator protein McsA